jgi:hypothetical protein
VGSGGGESMTSRRWPGHKVFILWDVISESQELSHAIASSDSEAINRAGIARMFRREPADIIVVNHDAALAIKISFPRPHSSGSKLDSDVYGGQQYAPLLSLEVPD